MSRPGTPYLPPQPQPGENWYRDDPALRRILRRRLGERVMKAMEPRLEKLGEVAPREVDPLARAADARPPRLVDEQTLAFDPSYRELQRLAREHETFTLSWRPLEGGEAAPRVATFALGYLYAQAECGYFCPACMTDGAAFVLARHPPQGAREDVVARLVQKDAAGAYEGAMFLTEPQGGSDVGATASVAEPAPDGTWRLTGHKWFASNADADVTLTLARMPGGAPGTRGLGLFLLPRALPDGAPNPGFRRVALKDKLGVRSMATAEVVLEGAHAHLVAGANEGFRAMAEMVNLSRLYNAVASVAIARRALREGQKNGAWRQAFGKPLVAHPLYRKAIAALANDVRGNLHLVLDTADTFDRAAAGDAAAYARLRALTPIAKAGTARLAVDAASQACEFLGGNGYVETWVTPRLLRDAQVLPIWEGTTHVQALDFLRAAAKDGAFAALAEDAARLLAEAPASPLRAVVEEAWRDLAEDLAAARAPAEAELRALRWLERAYHLRIAALLLHDARDGDAAALAHARAYVLRHVEDDEEAFEEWLGAESDALVAG